MTPPPPPFPCLQPFGVNFMQTAIDSLTAITHFDAALPLLNAIIPSAEYDYR